MTLLNRELVSRPKLCLVCIFPDIVKDCPKIRNLLKIFLRSFKNVGPGHSRRAGRWTARRRSCPAVWNQCSVTVSDSFLDPVLCGISSLMT